MAAEEFVHVPAGAFAFKEPFDAVAHERGFGDATVFAICFHESYKGNVGGVRPCGLPVACLIRFSAWTRLALSHIPESGG